MKISENIKKIRKEKGFSQKKLAEKTNLSIASIQGYEQGKYKPKFETLKKIAAALDCEISDIDENIIIIPKYKPTPEKMEQLRLEAEAMAIYEKEVSGKTVTLEEQQKLDAHTTQITAKSNQEEDAKNAPKFVAYDENGNEIKDRLVKFTDKSMSFEEALAEAEAEELERIQTAYKRLNRKGKAKAVERVEELTEISRYTKEDPPRDPFFMLSKKKKKR